MGWQPIDPGQAGTLPAAVWHWLDIRKSVSAEIERVMRAPMRVEVIRHGPGRALPEEVPLIAPTGGPVTVREVVLWAADRPCVTARTVYAEPRLRADEGLNTLGDRPLGALLFAGPEPCPFTHRDTTRIGPDMAGLFQLIREHGAPAEPFYWGRRTLFQLHGAPILCTEVFLPALLAETAKLAAG